jgi:hypothetical protein
MKSRIGLKLMCGMSLLLASLSANASLLTFNGNTVNALDLNGTSTSFEEFYGYKQSSGHTGLEMVNTVVMFMAELNGEYALFTTANKYDSGGAKGNLSVTLSATSGAVTFTDDPTDSPGAGFSMLFNWGNKLSDGFIFSGMDDNFIISQSMTSRKGVDGVRFVDFADGTFASQSYSALMDVEGDFVITGTSTAAVVSAPSALALMLFGIAAIVRRKANV